MFFRLHWRKTFHHNGKKGRGGGRLFTNHVMLSTFPISPFGIYLFAHHGSRKFFKFINLDCLKMQFWGNNHPPWLKNILKFVLLKYLKMHFSGGNHPSWLEKVLKFILLKYQKMHFSGGNQPRWSKKYLKFSLFQWLKMLLSDL